MSGFELLSVVRRRFPVVRVIAMSSAFSGGNIPAGVAADSFYQKATSVAALLKILEGPGRIEDARTITENSTSTPIWIATHPLDPEGTGLVMLPCHECLRIFPHTPVQDHTLVREARCIYCKTPIHFAMVETVDPGPPKDAARQPARQTQASFHVPSFS